MIASLPSATLRALNLVHPGLSQARSLPSLALPRAPGACRGFLEEAASLKLRFAEGEIDFVASAPLMRDATIVEQLFGVPG